MSDVPIHAAILRQQGFAVFESLGEGGFRVVGEPPTFLADILGEESHAATLRLSDRFPFL